MPPRKKITQFTLNDASTFLNSRQSAENSIKIWIACITTLVHYNETGDVAPNTTLSKAEQFDEYKDIDIMPLIKDFDKVVEIINKIEHSKKPGQLIALETKKSYYASVLRITDKPSPFQLSKELRKLYQDKFDAIATESNDIKSLNIPKGAVKANPDFTWLVALQEYRDFVTTASFTNTQNGRKNLRVACGVGLYVSIRPRRIQDYASLMYYSKKPSERELTDKNILYLDGKKMYISIDKFKTRFRTTTKSNKKKEVLPRFEKEINDNLASLFKDYIQKDNIGDMAKLSASDKRQGVAYYIFAKDDAHKEMYEDNSFSKLMTSFFKVVYKRPNLNVNVFRHIYNTFIMNNTDAINEKKMKQIAVEVGDTAKDFPTNTRYRTVDPAFNDMDITEIEGMLVDDDYGRKLAIAGAEEEGSVGNVGDGGNMVDAEEVVSPTPRQVPKTDNVGGGAGVVDEDLAVLYTRLGEAHMQVKLLEGLIAKKLNF